MLELLALLLPVAAASGWYAAKRTFRSEHLVRRSRELHASCTRGLGLLLQEKTDEAMEALSPVIESDEDSFELRLALGNFFRRRGEVDKALAIHQKLAEQVSVAKGKRACVNHALGMDYLAAGLLDRAEDFFSALLDSERYRAEALQQLLKIYQQERDWPKAIECTRALRKLNKLPNHESISQFYCELAEEHLTQGDDANAIQLLHRALDEDEFCARASIILGGLWVKKGCWTEALAILKKVEWQDPAFLSEVLEPIGRCFKGTGQDTDFPDYLKRLYASYSCEDAASLLAEHLQKTEGPHSACRYLQFALAEKSSLQLTQKMLQLLILQAEDNERLIFELILRSIVRPDRGSARYRCARCGFEGNELHWKCPSCQCWEMIKPNRDRSHVSAKP